MIIPIIWLITGALIGLLLTIVMHRRHPILLLNMVAGAIGAFLSGYLLLPMFHIDTKTISFSGMLVLIGGTLVLLGTLNFMFREHTMSDKTLNRKWDRVREKIHVRWGKLTEADIEQINGNHDRFIKTIQDRYGCDEKQAEDQLQGYLRAVV